MILEARGAVSLRNLQGYWRLEGLDRIWELHPGGQALLDGKYRGTGYDLTESGSGISRTIQRPDGWQVDIDKSTLDQMFWTMPGQADLQWNREDAARAQEAL